MLLIMINKTDFYSEGSANYFTWISLLQDSDSWSFLETLQFIPCEAVACVDTQGSGVESKTSRLDVNGFILIFFLILDWVAKNMFKIQAAAIFMSNVIGMYVY